MLFKQTALNKSSKLKWKKIYTLTTSNYCHGGKHKKGLEWLHKQDNTALTFEGDEE